jgi:hypothetical protein
MILNDCADCDRHHATLYIMLRLLVCPDTHMLFTQLMYIYDLTAMLC